jgi:rhamnulokinase
MNRHIAVDIGADSGRVIAGWLEDGKLVMQELHRFPTQDFYLQGRRQRNLYRWYEEILHGLSIYVQKFGHDLGSIGVNAMGHEYVLLDEKGGIRALPVSYRDSSFEELQLDELLEKKIDLRIVYMITGNQSAKADTLNRILIQQRDESVDFTHSKGILFLPDAMHYMLGAMPCCEMSSASYSRLLDQRAYIWSKEIFDVLAIDRSLMSDLVWAGDTIGIIDEGICRQLGLPIGIKIITPCGHDTADAMLCVPNIDKDCAFISSGTWSLIGLGTEKPVITEQTFKIHASNSTTGFGMNMLKKNVTGMWMIQCCRREWGGISYPEIIDMARRVNINDLTIDVDASKFQYAHNIPTIIASDVKDRYGVDISPNNIGQISRIIFESMAFKDRYMLDRLLSAIDDREVSCIYIVGGGAQNELLNQLIANITGLTVYAGAFEATSMGNILLQAYGCKEINGRNDLMEIASSSANYKRFMTQDIEVWGERYRKFLGDHDLE